MVVWAIALNALCILPSFLAGSLAPWIRSEFAFDDAAVGIAFSGYWLVAAAGALPCTRWVKRWGAPRSLQVAGIAAGIASAAIGLAPQNAVLLVVLVAVSGLVTAVAAPAVNVVIMSMVNSGRQAFAITAAGASPVLSLMVAGLAAPVIGEWLGWRWAYIINAAVAVLLALHAQRLPVPLRRRDSGAAGRRRGHSMTPLAMMMIGVGAGNAAVGAATGFLVVSAPSSGVSPVGAAAAVAAASGASIIFRLALASFIDRMKADPMLVVGLLLSSGAVGFVLLGLGTPVSYFTGLSLVLVFGWSWVSLLLYGVLARYRTEVVSASGLVQMVFFVGGVIGPGSMGLLVGAGSYSLAWWCLAGASLVAAGSVWLGRRRLPVFLAK